MADVANLAMFLLQHVVYSAWIGQDRPVKANQIRPWHILIHYDLCRSLTTATSEARS